jgi:hypothetical protein
MEVAISARFSITGSSQPISKPSFATFCRENVQQNLAVRGGVMIGALGLLF